ncbi:heme oxygenase-like protein [Favolaschia claudopus]|uniref:Heme oxygenase-like protein n=1 Tax=Favolaschia claudopus TaxID=2862362 RepID=A0AAW0EIJ9_9AGAR
MATRDRLNDCLSALAAPYAEATQHPFLQSAGDATIDPALFSLWLSQDRIYAAYAYPTFIGALIASIPFDKLAPLNSVSESANRRVLKALMGCLDNIVVEIDFFMAMASKYNLDLGMWQERKATRDYIAEMDSIASSRKLEEGLVFLWAMEKVYLDAWTFVRKKLQETNSEALPAYSMIMSFVPRWTSEEFVKFVDELAVLVEAANIPLPRMKEIVGRVVELEREFWPVTGEEVTMRKVE